MVEIRGVVASGRIGWLLFLARKTLRNDIAFSYVDKIDGTCIAGVRFAYGNWFAWWH
jgi:hypothetical protein